MRNRASLSTCPTLRLTLTASSAAIAIGATVSLMHSKCHAEELMMKPADPVFHGEIYGPTSRDANPAEWPATFVFRDTAGTECTATAIGPRAVLTAAHCIPATVDGTIETARGKIDITCQHNESYPEELVADFALCLVHDPLPAPAEGFEVINTDPAATPAGAAIMLLGFGCRTPGGSDRNFGRLSEGDAVVLSTKINYVVTGGGAGICLGDSGGGAYVTIDDFKLRRRLVAVNFRTDISSFSWLSLTASPLFTTWAKKWSADAHVEICGLHPSARSCHQ
jgi:hypothetical protein